MEHHPRRISKAEAFWRKGDRRQLARLYEVWDDLAPERRSEWLAIGRTLVTLQRKTKLRTPAPEKTEESPGCASI